MSVLRFAGAKIFNAAITLLVALLLISGIFAVYTVTELRGRLAEEYVLALRQLEVQYRNNPELLEEKSRQLYENLMERYGLTGNFAQDVVTWTVKLIKSNITFDFGTTQYSYIGGTNVIGDILLLAMKNTAILFLTATLITFAIGIILGFQMARKPGSILDRGLSVFGMISWSFPTWWVAIIMILLFSFYLRIFPAQAQYVYFELSKIPPDMPFLETLLEQAKIWLKYMTMPVMTIVLVSFGGASYLIRNIVLGILQEDFVTAARARGLPERRVIYGHVLRTSSPPIVTYLALSIVGAFGGAIITEAVFGWPGMGLVYWIAIQQSDARVLVASTWVLTVFFILTILILDFIYSLLDPRVRTGGA
ncbi:ABC transporter permease [Aeropyrum camini]|uniref:Peptide ABC transporter permease n=1 Tax=Aeropyrum camini SY1 = JCM 12091 TaxID=1198449 RepID=U3TES2_9CREN|nr:ABC transporter permease [Aeropyrum camini]BAN90463.1 peptide ABC transporter permease [Aeropyrum camini SY1 = JCM 12091]